MPLPRLVSMLSRRFGQSVLIVSHTLCLAVVPGMSWSQAKSPAHTDNGVSPPVLPAIAAPTWSELTAPQKSALEPLSSEWNTLGEGHRRKWLAIVRNFTSLSPEDQKKIQDRMTTWAALNPNERERARENFVTSKQAAPVSKSGRWEEYLALPPEEREKLAAQATKKKPSAAKNSKLRSAVGANNTKESLVASSTTPWGKVQNMRANLRDWVDPQTLLPLRAEK